jgi:hypothetical protein
VGRSRHAARGFGRGRRRALGHDLARDAPAEVQHIFSQTISVRGEETVRRPVVFDQLTAPNRDGPWPSQVVRYRMSGCLLCAKRLACGLGSSFPLKDAGARSEPRARDRALCQQEPDVRFSVRIWCSPCRSGARQGSAPSLCLPVPAIVRMSARATGLVCVSVIFRACAALERYNAHSAYSDRRSAVLNFCRRGKVTMSFGRWPTRCKTGIK